jgi:alkylhydroperoxidase/carboxymuconolactone decarboxylase family protein YurZ
MEVATGKEYRLGKTMKITLQGAYQKEIITAITAIQ